MKHLLFFSFILFTINSFGQNINGCEDIPLKEAEDYKAAEDCIIKLSDYVMSQPMWGFDEKAQDARKVVYAWVEGTPDYIYALDADVMKLFDDDNLPLFFVYVSTLANASLVKEDDFYPYAIELLVEYVNDPINEVVQTKKVKKLIKDFKAGKIEKYIQD